MKWIIGLSVVSTKILISVHEFLSDDWLWDMQEQMMFGITMSNLVCCNIMMLMMKSKET